MVLPDSNESPKFFKIYIPKFSSERLLIPQPFTKEFNGNIPKKAVLKNVAGRLWHVELEEDGDRLLIHNGWQNFVNDNSVQNGDFLVFAYSQSCSFDVMLYDNDGCEKDASFVENAIPCMEVKDEDESEEDEQTYSQCTPAHKGRGLRSVKKPRGSLGVRRSKLRSAESKVVAQKNPYFIALIGKTSHKYVNIPKKIVVENGIKIGHETKLRDENEKLWPIRVHFRKDDRIYMSGLLHFMEKKNLRLRDKCVFEFCLRGRICKEMCVHIIRASPPRSSHG